MTRITRRTALASAAALPFAKPLPAAAQAPMQGPSADIHRRFTMGGFEITTLLAFTRPVDEGLQTMFGIGVDADDFAAESRRNFIPHDVAQFFFTPTLVNTGRDLILFDTGFDSPGIVRALADAGHMPEDITVVVITHGHNDHIGGLMRDDGQPTFPNAGYVYGQADYDAWAPIGNVHFEKHVKPLAERMRFIGNEDAVVSGITGLTAPGHTPGHMVFMLESEGNQLLLAADTANHYVWSLANPEWEVLFDTDKDDAARTRRNIFGMLAADRIPFIGYHMPFPAIGYIEQDRNAFRYVPATYQMML